jgi:hypothetical protein
VAVSSGPQENCGGSTQEVGSSESEVEAVKARDREAHDECRGAKENCGCAAEKMGFGESEEARLNDNAATKVVPDHASSNPVSRM